MGTECTHPEHWFADFGKRDTQFELALQINRWFFYKHDLRLKPGTEMILWKPENVRSTISALYWDLVFAKDARKIGPMKKVTIEKSIIEPAVEEFFDLHRALIAELEVTNG